MRIWLVAASLGFVFGVLLAPILIFFRGLKATVPTKLESRLMMKAKRNIFVGNRAQINPLQPTNSNLADGKDAFSHYCVACHGLDGQNTGVPFAEKLSPPVPSLASRDIQSYTDGQLKWIIDNGIWPSGMPGSKGTLSDDEIWSIVLYLRHLPPAGSLGEPEMYQH
jgi:mono/diheme cytochrome c family protein